MVLERDMRLFYYTITIEKRARVSSLNNLLCFQIFSLLLKTIFFLNNCCARIVSTFRE